MARTSRQRSGRTAASVLAALALCATAYPARAEVILNQGTNGTYSIPVMSWWEIPFRSVVRQQYDFSCGSAAVATLLSYHYDRRTPEQAVFASMWDRGDQQQIRKVGFSMLDMKQYLDSIGYRTEGFRLPIDALRKTERPGIVLLDLKGYKHFVVVKGVKGDRVLVGDPTLGLGEYPIAEFGKLWNGIYLAVVQTPQQRRPSFNVAGDWGPWSSAPLEMGAQTTRVPIGNVTNEIGEIYQIIPRVFMIDVRELAQQQ